MTQQSLAEQLYVTRQAVSRWECGDRYPDLLTSKKISQILEVSLDDLLSEKEMTKVVERNPVIEKRSVNNIIIALYAFVVISFFITIIDIIIRFPLQSEAIDYSDIQLIIVNVLGLFVQVVFFTYGLVQVIRGTLSPKRTGVVITAYFGAMCILGSENVSRYTPGQLFLVSVAFIIPNLLCAIVSFLFFIQGNNNKMYLCMIYVISIWAMFCIIYKNCQLIINAEQHLSMNTTINLVLKIAIYGLIVYQTHTLWIKRKNALSPTPA